MTNLCKALKTLKFEAFFLLNFCKRVIEKKQINNYINAVKFKIVSEKNFKVKLAY